MKLHYLLFLSLLVSLDLSAKCESVNEFSNVGDIEKSFKCLESRVIKLEQGESNKVDVITQLEKKMTFSSSQSIEKQGIQIDINNCKKERYVICELRLTSLDEDIRFELARETTLFDESGFESGILQAELGGISASFKNNSEVRKRLVSNIPTKAVLKFPLPNNETTAISALRLVFELNNGNDNIAYIRNVLFSE